VSATEEESALTERAQHQGGERVARGPRGSEPFDQDRTEGVQGGPRGSKGIQAVRSRSDGGNQTEKDERLWVALTGGLGCQARVREVVSRGPGRAIKIGRGN
jgi:hypothetical protein